MECGCRLEKGLSNTLQYNMCGQKWQEKCILYSLFFFIMCEICHKEYLNEMEKNSVIVIWVKSWHTNNASVIL